MLEFADGLASTDASADIGHARIMGLKPRSLTMAQLRARRKLSR
jgi:hypothetical protein